MQWRTYLALVSITILVFYGYTIINYSIALLNNIKTCFKNMTTTAGGSIRLVAHNVDCLVSLAPSKDISVTNRDKNSNLIQ